MADKKTLEYEIKLISQQAIGQLQGMSLQFKALADEAQSASSDLKKNSTTFTSLEAAAKQAAASVKLFGASSSELRAMQQKIKDGAIALVAQGFEPEREEVKKLVEQYKSLGNQADKLEQKNGDLSDVFSKLKSEIGNVAAVAAAVKFDKFLVKVSDYALQSADAINTVRNNFGIMLNDMEAGSALADRFNVNTPFNLEQLSTATQVLKTAKVGLNDIEEYLTRFGDLALGDAQKFASFTNAFAKASAKGKADMEVLNIYLERGIPILDTLAKNMGKTSAEITDMASKGKISFNDLNDAIKTLTDEGGGYFGTMNLAADSWASTLAGAREATNSLVASLGNMLMPILKRIVNTYTDITNAINSSPLLKGLLVGAITALAVAINVKMIVALVALVTRIWTTYAAQMALNSALSLTNPLMLAGIAAVTAATAGFVAYAAAQQKATGESNEAALAAKKQSEEIKGLKDAAEDYMSFMNGSSLSDAQQTVSQYALAVKRASAEIAAEKQKLSELEEKLSATPKTTNLPYPGYKGYVDKSREYDNPEYKELEKQVEMARHSYETDKQFLDTLNARFKVAQEKAGEINQSILDFTTEWSQKLADSSNSSEIAKINALERKARTDLENKAIETFGDNYKTKNSKEYEAYQRELNALTEFYSLERQKIYDKEADKAKKKAEETRKNIENAQKNINAWISKGGNSEYERIQNQIRSLNGEMQVDIKSLRHDALTAFGTEFEKRVEYEQALNALRENYQNREHDLRMQQIEEYNSRFKKIIDELNLETVEAINAGNTRRAAGSSAKSAALSAAANTELGQIAQGFASGGIAGGIVSIIGTVVKAIADNLSELENAKVVLNAISTIIGSMFEVLGELINDALGPTSEFLKAFGKALGRWLRPLIVIGTLIGQTEPLIRILTFALEKYTAFMDWLYNKFIVPLYNRIAQFMGFFGVQVNQLKKITSSTDEAAAAAEKHAALLKKQYERQMSSVNDLLNAQIESIRSQYELGLINREEYNKRAEEYAAVADDKLYEIEKEMNEKLGAISDNTSENGTMGIGFKSVGEYLTDFVRWLGGPLASLGATVSNFVTSAWGKAVDFGSTVAGLPGAIISGASDLGSWISGHVTDFGAWLSGGASSIFKKLKFWDVGSYELPEDSLGVVHKGETIVPRTFAEGIRSGKLALVGGNSKNIQGGVVYNLQLTVEGSVVTEREITDVVYNGIARAIQSGSKAPLPMAG